MQRRLKLYKWHCMIKTRKQQYVEKEWIKGHNDFEAAALAKILGLDDSALKDNNHYPYDLAHYKNGMSFDLSWYGDRTNFVNEVIVLEEV